LNDRIRPSRAIVDEIKARKQGHYVAELAEKCWAEVQEYEAVKEKVEEKIMASEATIWGLLYGIKQEAEALK